MVKRKKDSMKILILFTTLFCLQAQSQELFKKSGNVLYRSGEIVIGSTKMKIGDTVFLSTGKAKNQNFKYASFRALCYENEKMVYIDTITPLPKKFANTFFILDMTIPAFYGSKKISDGLFIKPGSKTKVWIDLYNGIKSGEIKRISGQEVNTSEIQIEK